MPRGGGLPIYFSLRGRAEEQGVIFSIPTPGQGIIFVKISSITGSILVILDLQGTILCEKTQEQGIV